LDSTRLFAGYEDEIRENWNGKAKGNVDG